MNEIEYSGQYSNLNEKCKKIVQPSKLLIELKEHQKTIVYAMNELETKKTVTIKLEKKLDNNKKIIEEYQMQSNIGILGDKVGAGKSYDIIALVCSSSSKLVTDSNQKFNNYVVSNSMYCQIQK